MVNLKALIYPGSACVIGLASPLIPDIAGLPAFSAGAALVASLTIPSKSKGQFVLFLILWALSFAFSRAVFFAGAAP